MEVCVGALVDVFFSGGKSVQWATVLEINKSAHPWWLKLTHYSADTIYVQHYEYLVVKDTPAQRTV